MRMLYRGYVYESTLLEMPEMISVGDDDDYYDRKHTELLSRTEEVDSIYSSGVDFSIRTGATGYSGYNVLSITEGDELLGYSKFRNFPVLELPTGAIQIEMTYMREGSRGMGYMSMGYEYLLKHFGCIVSDFQLTDDSFGLYVKLSKKYRSGVYDRKSSTFTEMKFDGPEYTALDSAAYANGESNQYLLVLLK